MNLDAVEGLVVGGLLVRRVEFDRQREAWLASGRSADEGEAFVQHLVDDGKLSDFQASAVRAGIPGPYMLGPYRVQSFLTAGRLGNVFQAVHVEFQQPVALKIFPPTLSRNPEQVARLGREARVGVLSDNLHIVKTYQVGKVGEVPFIAFEDLEGETLQQRLDRDGRIPFTEASLLIEQAAQGLGYLHEQGVIHRDICPANLWVTNGGIIKILEFGAARDALSYLDSLNAGEDGADGAGELTIDAAGDDLLGHYPYMSAAQAQSPQQANVATDLYSLGCTLYHCLTGQVPFPEKNPVRQMLRHATETPRPLAEFAPEIPAELQAIVSRLLVKDLAQAYESAEEVAAALSEFEPGAPTVEANPVNPEFLHWLQSGAHLDQVTEVQYEPDFQKFVDWVSIQTLPPL